MSPGSIKGRIIEAKKHAGFGMPPDPNSRFRLAKRLIYRSLLFLLRHQLIVNTQLIEGMEGLNSVPEQLAMGLRQNHLEIGDVAARLQGEHIRLQLSFHQLERRIGELLYAHGIPDSHTHVEQHDAGASKDPLASGLPDAVSLRSADEPKAGWDELSRSFHDVFRGSPQVIRERLKVYLEDLKRVGRDGLKVLDLGCGRGEWLKLLSEEGIPSYGVDRDPGSVKSVHEQDLDARCDDILSHLRSLPPESLGAITAFHLVEHIGIEQLVLLLDLSLQSLVPDGLLVLETPNPENLFVATHAFYLDPTHRNPIPPQLLVFLVSSRGFADTSVRRFQRTETASVSETAWGELDKALAGLLRRLQDSVLVGEDYAVLARRGR